MRTETMSPLFSDLDAWSSLEAVHAMFEGQLAAVAAVRAALPAIAAAAEAASMRLGEDGRLVYAGAGTSGRIAVQDGVELLPTFSWPEDRAVFAIAGGERALFCSAEGAEDDRDAAKRAASSSSIAAGAGPPPPEAGIGSVNAESSADPAILQGDSLDGSRKLRCFGRGPIGDQRPFHGRASRP